MGSNGWHLPVAFMHFPGQVQCLLHGVRPSIRKLLAPSKPLHAINLGKWSTGEEGLALSCRTLLFSTRRSSYAHFSNLLPAMREGGSQLVCPAQGQVCPVEPAHKQVCPAEPAHKQVCPVKPAYKQVCPVEPAYKPACPVEPAYNPACPVEPAYKPACPVEPAYKQVSLSTLSFSDFPSLIALIQSIGFAGDVGATENFMVAGTEFRRISLILYLP